LNLGLVLKRSRRFWQQLGILTVGICLVTAFFALAPIYVRSMIQSGLKYETDKIAPIDQYVTFINPKPYQAEAWPFVSDQLGALAVNLTRITRTGRAFPGFDYVYGQPTDIFTGRPEFSHYAYAFSNMTDILRVVEGRFPVRLPPPDAPERQRRSEEDQIALGLGMYSRGDVEAVITRAVAQRTGYGVDTRFAVGFDPGKRTVVHVVGIVEAVNPEDLIWNTNRMALTGEVLQPKRIGEPPGFNLSFIVTEGAFTDWIVDAAKIQNVDNTSYVWWIKLDPGVVSADNMDDVRARLALLGTRMVTDNPGLLVFDPLVKTLNNYTTSVSRTEGPVILLSGAVLVLMLYHLVTTVSLVLEQQTGEWASFSSRGASLFQLVFLQGLTMLLLCVIGFVVGPPLALLILQALLVSGPLISATGGTNPIGGIPPNAFWLSGIAAAAALVMLTLPAIPAARRSLAQFKQIAARPPKRPAWARFGLDVILIITGIGFMARLLFYVEGDLGSTLSLLFTNPRALIQLILDSANRTGGLSDPLNLLGPALLLTGIALLWLRIFPALIRLLSTPIRANNGLTAPLSVWNVEREPGHYAQLVLLLIGTLALGTAALALGATRDSGAWGMAQLMTGSTVRVNIDPSQTDADKVSWTALPGVTATTTLTRYETVQRAGYTQYFLAGVTPDAISSAFPGTAEVVQPLVGQKTSTKRILVSGTRRFSDVTFYPAVISSLMAREEGRAQRSDKQPLQVGDEMQLDLYLPGNQTVTVGFHIVGVTRTFPSLAETQQFVVLSAPMVSDIVGKNMLAFATRPPSVNEIWLELNTREPSAALKDALGKLGSTTSVTYAWDSYNRLLREPLPASIAGMLYAGFLVSLLLSLLDFGFYLVVTARRRSLGFAVLRALGWNINRIWALLVTEQAVLVIPALLVGVALGAALAYVILPFLALFGATPLLLPLLNLLALLAVLLAGFALLALLAAWWLRRLNINQVLRLGEE